MLHSFNSTSILVWLRCRVRSTDRPERALKELVGNAWDADADQVGNGYGSGGGSDKAAIKLLWLALRNVLAKPSQSVHTWKAAMNQFAILFGERFTEARD